MADEKRTDDIASGKGPEDSAPHITDEAARAMLTERIQNPPADPVKDDVQGDKLGDAAPKVEPTEPKLEDAASGFENAYATDADDQQGVSADAPEGVRAKPVEQGGTDAW